MFPRWQTKGFGSASRRAEQRQANGTSQSNHPYQRHQNQLHYQNQQLQQFQQFQQAQQNQQNQQLQQMQWDQQCYQDQQGSTGPAEGEEFDAWASRQMSELHSQLVQFKQNFKPTREQNETGLSQEIEQAKLELERVKSDLDKAKTELERVHRKLGEDTARLEKLSKSIKEKEEENTRFSKRLVEKQRDIDSARQLVREVNATAHRKRQEVAELTAKIERRQKMLSIIEWEEKVVPVRAEEVRQVEVIQPMDVSTGPGAREVTCWNSRWKIPKVTIKPANSSSVTVTSTRPATGVKAGAKKVKEKAKKVTRDRKAVGECGEEEKTTRDESAGENEDLGGYKEVLAEEGS